MPLSVLDDGAASFPCQAPLFRIWLRSVRGGRCLADRSYSLVAEVFPKKTRRESHGMLLYYLARGEKNILSTPTKEMRHSLPGPPSWDAGCALFNWKHTMKTFFRCSFIHYNYFVSLMGYVQPHVLLERSQTLIKMNKESFFLGDRSKPAFILFLCVCVPFIPFLQPEYAKDESSKPSKQLVIFMSISH